MFEIQILVPKYDNNGVAFLGSAYRAFEKEVAEKVGGFTRLPEPARGGWIQDGRFYEDETFIYVVAIQSLSDGPQVVELARTAKKLFRQEAIFIRYFGIAEVIE